MVQNCGVQSARGAGPLGVRVKTSSRRGRAAESSSLPDMKGASDPVQDRVPAPPPSAQPLMSNNSKLNLLEDQVLCPICLEVFHNPVTTACGHNFCMTCLQGFWDHQATMGETPYCPQCRQSFPCRPHLCKNVTLGEMVACFVQTKAQASKALQSTAGPGDVPCDFCSPQKLKSVKSCLQCVASLCEKHLSSHFEDQIFQGHQLLEPVWDLKSRLCRKHRKLRRLYCRTEGCSVCGACLLEEHRNHEAVPLEEERACKEAEVRKVQANVDNQMLIITSDNQKHRDRTAFLSKLIQNMRNEVNSCFSEIIQQIKQLHVKILEFLSKEEATVLGKLGTSIQQCHSRLLELEEDSVWLRNLLTNQSDQQFMQEIPRLKHFSTDMEPLMGTTFEEDSFLQLPETLVELQTQMADVGFTFLNQLLLRGIKTNSYEVLPPAVDRKALLKSYCNLHFDPASASPELFLFKEAHSVLNLGVLLEPTAASCPGFAQWPQVLCSRGLAEGCHYWEADVSDSWVCLGVTYRRCAPASGRPRRSVVYLLGRNPDSWCLEWDSLRFSVWHDNQQTVLPGAYQRTLGVALNCATGHLAFYGVAGGASLIYRFLATFLEPLYPAVMVGSGASVTLRQLPEA
ncbi:PREDICTED: E3 ubiquitin/ISG15 ligase TRIM25-like [Elephantulus edwardii]|uniref:E3 ubiquitin/ISG15 ligase TRIM25-like n=1 Tax=Elephantulus edwardii TaxID=28737 RepID=UPI0003F072BB|nr:PREDICTED: E3 ubiquitin/ISG15 ligase TRIM25-like [Elephantulus edwardii]